MHVVGGIILSLQINDFTFFCGFIPSICFISPLISTHTSPQPVLFLSCPPPCLLIHSGADDVSSAGYKRSHRMLRKSFSPESLLKILQTKILANIIQQMVFFMFWVQKWLAKLKDSGFISLIIQLSWSKSLRRSSGQGSAVLLTAISNPLPCNSLWDPNKRIGSALLRQVRLDFT